MKIENLQQLQKLINLCHKNNIMTIEVDGIKLELGVKPVKTKSMSTLLDSLMPTDNVKIMADKIASDELTPDQLLNWSSATHEQQ